MVQVACLTQLAAMGLRRLKTALEGPKLVAIIIQGDRAATENAAISRAARKTEPLLLGRLSSQELYQTSRNGGGT